MKRYHQVFLQRYKEIKGSERIERILQRCEARRERETAVEEVVRRALTPYASLKEARQKVAATGSALRLLGFKRCVFSCVKLLLKYGNITRAPFSAEEDKFLVRSSFSPLL